MIAVDRSDIEARHALFDQSIEAFLIKEVAVGLQHELCAGSRITFAQAVEDGIQFVSFGQRLAPREDEAVDAFRQVVDDLPALLFGDAIALRAGEVIAMIAPVVTKVGKDPV
jgi:hypothetical protein